MTNSELINAYLDNELNEADRLRFEERISRDPDLKQELDLHNDIIEGLKNARREQLKHRLNQVDVGGNSGWSTAQVLGTVAIVAAGVAAVYFLYPSGEMEEAKPVNTEISEAEPNTAEIVQPEENNDSAAEEIRETEQQSTTAAAEESEQSVDTAIEEIEETAEADIERQPEDKRPVVAPSFDNDDSERAEVTAPDGAILGEVVTGNSRIDVEVTRNLPNRNFHYAFENNTLKLYGEFDEDLYEVLEFNSNKGTRWFLSYKGKFYNLDGNSTGIMPLREITDNKLLDVLKNIR